MKNYIEIKRIKMSMALGNITYSQAKELAEPIISKMNTTGSAIAKAHNMPFKPFTFTGLMR